MKTFVPFVLLVALLSGCVLPGMPGHVDATTSKLDGERQVQVAPAWLFLSGFNNAAFQVGGFWSDKTPDKFFLEIVPLDPALITELKIGLDGKVMSLPATNGSRFEVSIAFAEQLVAAEKAIFQVRTPKSFMEGVFSFDQATYARPAFRQALKQIAEQKGQP